MAASLGEARGLDVLVICEINVDIVVTGIEGPPKFGAEQFADGVVITAGSSGVLTATGLASLGLRVGVCGLVGDDLFGRVMLDHFDRWHIDRSAVVVDSAVQTGSSVCLSGAADRAILTHPGAMALFDAGRIAVSAIERSGHLHLSSYFLQERLQGGILPVLDRARAQQKTVSADTGHDPREIWDVGALLSHLDVFLPNEVEALAISGCRDIPAALDWLAARVPCAAVKRGGAGASAVRGEERLTQAAYATQVVDTTGAGDAFDAGFLSSWLAGHDLQACLQRGNACGSLTAAHVGGTGAISLARAQRLIDGGTGV